MRIYTKKAFRFDHPSEPELTVLVRDRDFTDVPDWVANSTMFKLAEKDGDVMVIDNREDEIAAETGRAQGKRNNTQSQSKTTATDDPAAATT